MTSRNHCRIFISSKQTAVKDVGSSNGTFVNKNKIDATLIYLGDKIIIGETVITILANQMTREERKIHTRSVRRHRKNYISLNNIAEGSSNISKSTRASPEKRKRKRIFGIKINGL